MVWGVLGWFGVFPRTASNVIIFCKALKQSYDLKVNHKSICQCSREIKSFITGIKFVYQKSCFLNDKKSTLRILVKNMTIVAKGAVIFKENQNFYISPPRCILLMPFYLSNARIL